MQIKIISEEFSNGIHCFYIIRLPIYYFFTFYKVICGNRV